MIINNFIQSLRRMLPAHCHVVIPGLQPGANVALATYGLEGLVFTKLNFGETHAARAAIRILNAANGISAVEEHAMLAGSMFGWDIAQANPDFLRCTDRRFCETSGMQGRLTQRGDEHCIE